MRNGLRAWDADTHVNPAAEVLERYVDPSFRPRLAELAPHRHRHRPDDRRNRRAPTSSASARSSTVASSARRSPTRPSPAGAPTGWGRSNPESGVQDDQAENRIKDMDDEGTDAHFLVPTSWVSVVGLPDVELEVGLIRAYHRHAADFCGQYPDRLKTMVVASTRDVDEAVREIRRWGTSKWAVAVLPVARQGHPRRPPRPRAHLESRAGARPGRRAPQQLTWNPPYFPGYEDLWDNIFLGRLASHPWGGMRFMAAFIGAGIMDRYPSPAHGHPRMRLRLAALLGQAHGRAGGLRRRRGAAQARAQRVHDQRPLLLHHRAPRGRGPVQLRHGASSGTTF